MTADEELTEEERVEYEKGILTWGKVRNWRFWIRKEWIWYYVAFVIIVVLVALMAFFHKTVSFILPLPCSDYRCPGYGTRVVRGILIDRSSIG